MERGQVNGSFQRRAIAAGLFLTMSYGLIGNTLGFFVVPVTEGLGITRASFNLYYSILSIVSMIMAPVYGRIYKTAPLKWPILAGLMTGGFSYLALSMAHSVYSFYIVAVFLGLVQMGATSMAAVMAVSRAYEEEAGGAMGLVMAGTGVISIFMSFLLPECISRFTWRGGYLLQAALWTVFMGAAFWLLREESPKKLPGGDDPNEQPGGEDPEKLPDDRDEGPDRTPGTASGDRAGILSDPVLYALFLCVLVLSVCSIFIHHMPAYYAERGMDSRTSGAVIAAFNIIMIFCKVGAGRLYDSWDQTAVTALEAFLLALGVLVMAQGSFPFIAVGTLFSAVGMPLLTVIFPLVTRRVFGDALYAPAWGLISMGVSLGVAVGSPLWGMIYDRAGSYRIGMVLIPAISMCAAAGLLMICKNARRDENGHI